MVSISGETTAPLPLCEALSMLYGHTGFNLRRDHRSLATPISRKLKRSCSVFQSQARPPLPCHGAHAGASFLLRHVSISGETTAPLPPQYPNQCSLHKSEFQSQARPPLPCHRRNCRRRQKSEQVSISGETTAPLPLRATA